jgi:hypothetical protein
MIRGYKEVNSVSDQKISTAQAIFLARRLMDISERTGSNPSLVLLDWIFF